MSDIPRTEPTSSGKSTTGEYRPADYDPDMAAAVMASELVKQMGTPSIVTKNFVVWHGVLRALNHTPENPTYIDTSLEIAIYDHVAKNSVNIDGQYFNHLWAYLMKPKFIITQNSASASSSFEDDRPTLGRRILDRLTGKSQEAKPNGSQ